MKKLSTSKRAVLVTSVVACVGVVGTTAGYAAGPLAKPVSKFSHGTEGWVVKGDPVSQKPQWVRHGGHPGGFIRATDAAQGGIMYWHAPAKFLGDQGAAYGGMLKYDVRERGLGRRFDAIDVVLSGGGVRLTYEGTKGPKGSHWTTDKVTLTEAGWLDQGQPATKADMLTVLASLGMLSIRAEYESHSDQDDLDNVAIKYPK